MKFGKSLKNSIYPPWHDQYIDYDKLKKLLRESNDDGQSSPTQDDDEDYWTEQDESAFVEELINVQLEKVNGFQASTAQRLKDETAEVENLLEPLGVKAHESASKNQAFPPEEEKKKTLEDALSRLDKITKETNELEKYSRINYTGFLKAAKKHDRKRGQSYRVSPLLRVRLGALPFNSEDYSPLLYRLSAMYSFVRQMLAGKDHDGITFEESISGGEPYQSYKFWVHPENLTEVKTIILRRLPVLVFNPQSSKVADGSVPDPTVTSIYFDNSKFTLYDNKVNHNGGSSSLRLRWHGQLADNPQVFMEKKTMKESGESKETRFPIKPKYIMPFIRGDFKMEKTISKLEEREGDDSSKVKNFKEEKS